MLVNLLLNLLSKNLFSVVKSLLLRMLWEEFTIVLIKEEESSKKKTKLLELL